EYLTRQQARLAEKRADAEKLVRRMPIPIALLSLLAAAIATLLGVVVARSIAKPLSVAVTHLEQVAGGDASREVPEEYLVRGDEIGLLSKATQTMLPSRRNVT